MKDDRVHRVLPRAVGIEGDGNRRHKARTRRVLTGFVFVFRAGQGSQRRFSTPARTRIVLRASLFGVGLARGTSNDRRIGNNGIS